MCEYCDVNNYSNHLEGIKRLTLDWNHCTGLRIQFDFNNNKFTMVGDGEGEAKIDINYCPKCGRKLT